MIIPVPTITSRNIRPRRRPAPVPAPVTFREEEEAAKTGREAVSTAKLLAFINHEVEARPECRGVKVRAGAWSLDPYADECNWSETSLVVHVAGMVGAGAFQELRKVIAIARDRYDVAAPEAYLL
ncbi:MAG TPA: hypothetical protein VF541_12155 [Longimicrobium sp.]